MSERDKRHFELPGINELSKAQEAVNYLAAEGKYLVVGGPGTGKSVVALLRARYLAGEKRKYLFLVYNVLLEIACRQLYPELECARWIGWFKGLHRNLFGKNPSPKSSTPGDFDWKMVEKNILEADTLETSLEKTHLIIDEGQDMPAGFYEALAYLNAERLFVAADQNQQITEANSTIREIRECLEIPIEEQIRLTENFRQKDKGYHVALLADAFYPGDPASTHPQLPPRQSTETPWLYTYGKHLFETIIRRIVLIVDRHPRELVGIITPTDDVRNRYFHAIRQAAGALRENGAEVPVATYRSGLIPSALEAIRFDRGGILVINAMACKGLEFDTVFIADVNDFYLDPDANKTKRLFYTMVARARERVFLLRRAGDHCAVDAIMPDDETILKRN
ncbi:hypothetical protein DSCO28_51130 [Desulfosarcina ovata subsp. sediminis]|uniref:DNA 3'-5' helicase II n=1 Tax=Desulfosarcina ovata subsp. sediminis TaxID=885957 RepID=A0A5K7ZWA8_9BACT|nr:ATP-binding domain-containing protein [Desulfosarcina ovata]BBO84547.1 hypothetical protein DSCO28_51130 [Desulfosarcina ovata subsp. sediminis]